MKNKAQSFKKSMNHLVDYKLCYTSIVINTPYSVYWGYGDYWSYDDGSNEFNVAIYDEGGYRTARLRVDIGGCWVLRYENRREREEMEFFGAEPTEEEDINLERYFEDPLNPTGEEASLFCLLFANLSDFLIEASNRILEEEVDS